MYKRVHSHRVALLAFFLSLEQKFSRSQQQRKRRGTVERMEKSNSDYAAETAVAEQCISLHFLRFLPIYFFFRLIIYALSTHIPSLNRGWFMLTILTKKKRKRSLFDLLFLVFLVVRFFIWRKHMYYHITTPHTNQS